MRLACATLVLLAAAAASACTASLTDAPCPCITGYVCSPETQTCQPGFAEPDAARVGAPDAGDRPDSGLPDAGPVPDAGFELPDSGSTFRQDASRIDALSAASLPPVTTSLAHE